MPLFDMDPNTANNLVSFGGAMMQAGGQPGASFAGAAGAGIQGMGEAAQKRAATNLYQQQGIKSQLENALTMRGVNMMNTGLGMPQVNMPGVPNLMPQQAPPSNSGGMPYSPNAGMTVQNPAPTRAQPSNSGMSDENADKMRELYPDSQSSPAQQPPAQNGAFGYSREAQEVAMGRRAPQSVEEATQAASLLAYMGTNKERQKQLEVLAEKQMEPQSLRPGGGIYYPLGGKSTTMTQHVQGYDENNVPTLQSYTPSIVTGGQNTGRGGNSGQRRNIGRGVSGIRTGFSPEEEQTQKNFFGPEQTAYSGAVNAKGKLFTMQQDLDTLNANPDFLSTGSGGSGRIAFAKAINAGSQAVFGGDFYNPEKVAAGESLFKVTGNLGFDMSKQLGAREPGVITQQAIKLNPGMDNTPQGAQLIKNTLLETQQRTIDERAFKTQYYQQNGYHQSKAEQEFDSKYAPELYAQRASSLIKPLKVNTPAGAKQLLAGTKIATPKGIKIIPPGIGITPPTYQDIQAPRSISQEPAQGDEE